MAPIVYGQDFSPPTRAVYMTAKHIGLELEIRHVDMFKLELMTPAFLKINPAHTVPTFVENDFILTDSHAITAYIVGKYSKDGAIYPKFLQQRALIDQMLHFDSSIMFPALKTITRSLATKRYDVVPVEHLERVYEAYSFLEKFLDGKDFVSGKNISIVDFHLYTTATACDLLVPFDQDYANINKWLNRVSNLTLYDNTKGMNDIKKIFGSLLSSN